MSARTPVPAQFRDAELKATQKQLDYLRDLIEMKNVISLPEEQIKWLQTPQPDEFWDAETTRLTKAKASRMIRTLVELPKLVISKEEIGAGQNMPTVEDGRYAVVDPTKDHGDLHFFKVKNGRSRVFLDVYASDVRWPITNNVHKRAVLAEIAKDPVTAMKLFGEKIGKCGRCGRTLTDPTSRAFGIGPDCRAAMGL